MKKLLLFLVFFNISCFKSSEVLLIRIKEIPKFTAPSDKALCVIIRTEGFSENISNIYLDTIFATATEENTVSAFLVSPGTHFIISKIDAKCGIKCNFVKEKVYFIKQNTWVVHVPTPMATIRTHADSLSLISAREMYEVMEKRREILSYVKPDRSIEIQNLDKEEFFEELDDYNDWAKENPHLANKHNEYQGF